MHPDQLSRMKLELCCSSLDFWLFHALWGMVGQGSLELFPWIFSSPFLFIEMTWINKYWIAQVSDLT